MLMEKINSRLRAVADERYRNFYMQRFVTSIPARERYADAAAARLPVYDGPVSPEAEADARRLGEDGYVVQRDLITSDQIAEIREFLGNVPFHDPCHRELGEFAAPDNIPTGSFVAHVAEDVLPRIPHLLNIANRPDVLDVVARILGAKPTISCLQSSWSVPSHHENARQAEKFYRDVDDWRFVKLFIFLTEIDEEAGPHVVVKGSHKLNMLTEIRRYGDEEVGQVFGVDQQVRLTGPAGSCFLEDAYGLHREFPPVSKPRLTLQVFYSLRPVIYGPIEPIGTLGVDGVPADIDPYINRVYCHAA